MAGPADTEQKEVIEFLATRRVIVADTTSGSRAGLAKIIIGMGASTKSVFMCNSFELAATEIERSQPEVIISDYDIGKRCGLDLIPLLRKHHPNPKDCLFMLVTGNTSQSAVAQAAEEDVDVYILKPYTIDALKKVVRKAILAKAIPSDYIRKLDEGKEALYGGNPKEAKLKFEEAMELDPKPALAMFYHGQAEMMEKALDSAHADYEEGLEMNKIHYKCLTGLFDILMQKKEYADAYGIVKKISQYFPANPTRMAQVLRLAIMTKSYEDVEKYYQVFTNMGTRHDEMVRYMCAALVVCGKYYLRGSHMARAHELFNKAGITAAGRTKILREIIMSLCEFNQGKQASEYLKRFPAETTNGADYLAMNYLVTSQGQPSTAIVDQGRKLLKQTEDPVIYKLLIEHSLRCKLKDNAETLLGEAKTKFPPMVNELQTVYELTVAELAAKKR